MNNADFDLRLLAIFQELMQRRNVSHVAEAMSISQPTVSRGLNALRSHFDDQLFVRTHRGMEPTPCALEIAPTVREMLDLYHSQLTHKRRFDPQTSKRTFKIAASEVGHILLFPRLLSLFEENAINVSLKGVPLGLQSLISELETGEVDVAIGAFPKLYAGVYERRLFDDHYVCLVRSDHPKIKKKLSLSDFEKAQHIITSVQGLGHVHEQVEKQLYELCPKENVRVVSHNFFTCALIAEHSNCIVTVPSRVLTALGQASKLRAVKSPLKLPTFAVKQYWHERFHREPANQWIRRTIADCLK